MNHRKAVRKSDTTGDPQFIRPEAIMTKKVEREIERAAVALGFRRTPTFRQAEKKLFRLFNAGPSKFSSKRAMYFESVVKPYVELAWLIDRVEKIKAEIKTRPRRIAEIRNEARKLAVVRGETAAA